MPAATSGPADNSLLYGLGLMRELEGSLERGQRALLSLDVAGVEAGNREQTNLIRRLDQQLSGTCQALAPAAPMEQHQKADVTTNSFPLREELDRIRCRILEATRLQTALLARMRGKLRILANMLAGPGVSYRPSQWPLHPSTRIAARGEI